MEYKYEPITKTALISAIRTEIKLQGCRANLNCINTSAITNMRELFNKFKSFDGDISEWDVSNVTDMTCMFSDSQFRGDISRWNVDKVEYFFPMFRWCRIPDEHKPERFRWNRDADSPTLAGKMILFDDVEVSFTLTGDGVLTLTGDLNCNLDTDYYRGMGGIPVRKLILGEGITEIGEWMFYEWRNLEEISFPESLTTIHDRAFERCGKIAELNFPKKGLLTIGSSNFSSCEIRELHLPETLTSLGSHCFNYLKNLKSVKLPAHLKEIRESSFSRCTALEHVEMPAELERIERYAFMGCPNLKAVELPATVKSIGYDTFESVDFEKDGLVFTITNYNTNINTCSVSGGKKCAGEVIIPSSVSYEGRTFTVSSIDEAAFKDCVSLKSIELPDSVTEIPESLFDGCWRLRNVRLGSKTTKIGAYAFRDCEFLQHIQLPDTIRHISIYAFKRCVNLVDINMPASLECLGTYALEDTPIMMQDGPIYWGRVLCGFGGNIPKHACLEVREGTTVIAEAALRGRGNLESVILPESLRFIGYEAFNSCDDLKHVHLNKSLQSIEEDAFKWTAITEVELPWNTPIEVDRVPFSKKAMLYVPVGAGKAYSNNEKWGVYKLEEKVNCASDPQKYINEDTVIVGRKETYRVILVEKAPRKHPWNLYGEIVPSKSAVDERKAVKDLLFESFRDTAVFLDWEEDRDAGHCQPLSEILEYNTHRYAVVDLPKDAAPETKQFNGRTYLTDEVLYNELRGMVKEWKKLE